MGLLDFDYHPSLRATITLPIAKDDTMKNRNISLSGFCLVIASFATLTGCEYEEDDVHSQAEPETNMIQQPQQKRSSGTDFANTPNSSLGAARRSATSIISAAEQHSQNVANQADELAKPGG